MRQSRVPPGRWPGHRLVGPDAARAAWSIALHSDDGPDLQLAAIILLERAAQAGDAHRPLGAALISNGRVQQYETQVLLNPEGITLCPLRAPESLDERRATVGLPPIAVALEAVRHRYAPGHAEDAPTVVLAGAARRRDPRRNSEAPRSSASMTWKTRTNV
ncbi:hypothetical protein [Streptomyces sp. NPDC058542]|uniref:hypothetical protein n=1 Tax=Streptomyces sp. NPDC058542 TaxID=3346543 RepID=UPI00365A77F0